MKHHYIPAFYLRQWANGPKSELCEYKKVYRSIAPRRTSAEGTGYLENLYRVDGVPADAAHNFETIFMKLVDTDAYRALVKIINDPRSPWPGNLRSAWTRFITSLLFRNPETVALIKAHMQDLWQIAMKSLEEDYKVNRRACDPESFSAYYNRIDPAAAHISAARMLQEIIDNDRVGPTVFGMIWSRIRLKRSKIPLLTSDRPLDMPIGLAQKNAYIAIPVGPYDLFLAAYDPGLARSVSQENPTALVKKLNLATVRRARLYVWGVNDYQLEFVRKHFGKYPDREILSPKQMEEARMAARSTMYQGGLLPK